MGKFVRLKSFYPCILHVITRHLQLISAPTSKLENNQTKAKVYYGSGLAVLTHKDQIIKDGTNISVL